MKIIRYENPEVTNVTTTLLESTDFDKDKLKVGNTSNFNVDDILLIEDVGNEKNEIVYITSIDNNEITVTPKLVLPHERNTSITKLNYDKFKIERSDAKDGTYEKITEQILDYANPHNIIEYFDMSEGASDKLFYKVIYYNSITEDALESDVLHLEMNYGYIDVDTFRAETGFLENEVSDSEIERAIYHSIEFIQDDAFVTHEFEGGHDSMFNIETRYEFADWNGDGIVDKKDMIIYEYDYNTTIRRYLGSKVSKIMPKSKKIFFKEQVPTKMNQTLVMKIPLTFKRYDEVRSALATISKLIATNWILRNVDINKVRNGITNWNAGGTSVTRDTNAIQESINNNLRKAKSLINQIRKIYSRPTKLRTQASMLNYRTRDRAFIQNIPSRRW